MMSDIGLVDAGTAEKLQQDYAEQAQRAKTNFEYYQRNRSAVCWKCHTVTYMYFIGSKAAETACTSSTTCTTCTTCIDCVRPEDLDDNIWTVDRFRAVMRPLYEEYERLLSLYFGDNFRSTTSNGPALLGIEGQILHRRIEAMTDSFFKKLKDSRGERKLVE